MIPVSTDDEGLIVDDSLERKFAQYRPSLLYTIPTYNNPKGTTMGIERRQNISCICLTKSKKEIS